MKKPLITLGCIFALALPAIGLAGNSGDGSEYGTQPGYPIANENTECAGHGANRGRQRRLPDRGVVNRPHHAGHD